MIYNITIESQQCVLKSRYGKQLSWVKVAEEVHVDERTCIRWRDDFKSGIAGHLGETLKPLSISRQLSVRNMAEKMA